MSLRTLGGNFVLDLMNESQLHLLNISVRNLILLFGSASTFVDIDMSMLQLIRQIYNCSTMFVRLWLLKNAEALFSALQSIEQVPSKG